MKLTKADFLLFQKECQKWIKVLGLNSWTVYYYFKPQEDNEIATCNTLYSDRVASITLATSFSPGGENKRQILCDTALHEALEILFSTLLQLAEERTWDKITYEKEHHLVIRTIQNLLEER